MTTAEVRFLYPAGDLPSSETVLALEHLALAALEKAQRERHVLRPLMATASLGALNFGMKALDPPGMRPGIVETRGRRTRRGRR